MDSHHYTYDDGGNSIKGDTNYQYDSSNRLLKGIGSYQYDVSGNITSGNGHTFNYDSDSRFTKIDGKATASDKDGNLTNYTLNGASHTAGYNSQNQLTDFDATHYDYDADGNRLYHGSVYASGKLLQDDDYLYVYGANGLVSFSSGDKFYTNAYNNRGDVTKTFDNTGVSGTIKYSDYGAVTSQTGIVSTFKYAGQHGAITDSNGLVYLQTRYYNPQLMRFMNRDTVSGSITDSQSLNRFSYVEGNPLTYVDLNGQARTWLKDNYELIHGVFLIASILPIPYFAPVFSALNLGLDLVAGHPENAIADALGILIPVGIAKLADSGLRIGLPVVTNSIADSLTPALATSVSQVSVKASDAGQVALWGYRAYSANKGTSEVASTVNTHPKKKPYSNPKRRPKYAPGQVEAVWEKARAASSDGIVRDPHTGKPLYWNKSMSRAGQWDMGHTPGNEYRKLHARYMADDIDKSEYLREYRNVDNYVPEDVHANRSHTYEEK